MLGVFQEFNELSVKSKMSDMSKKRELVSLKFFVFLKFEESSMIVDIRKVNGKKKSVGAA